MGQKPGEEFPRTGIWDPWGLIQPWEGKDPGLAHSKPELPGLEFLPLAGPGQAPFPRDTAADERPGGSGSAGIAEAGKGGGGEAQEVSGKEMGIWEFCWIPMGNSGW